MPHENLNQNHAETPENTAIKPSRRYSIAPMLDWTDRYYRHFARMLSTHAWLYTEMINTGAILHGDKMRHLRFDEVENPLALQLGGSEPADLARCAKIAEDWGYDEVNLNVGCPSERVQSGSFGACLMADPELVSDCVKAMRDAVSSTDITVKHRIGIDDVQSYDYVRDFVGHVAQAGCQTFIVHARNAILKGLSPKENREIPPLKYDFVYQLKKDFPALEIIINGGITDHTVAAEHLQHVDGVMIGREAYHNPFTLADVDHLFYGEPARTVTREEVMQSLRPFVEAELKNGTPLRFVARHILGLYQGQFGARQWRRMLSDSKLLKDADWSLIEAAMAQTQRQHIETP